MLKKNCKKIKKFNLNLKDMKNNSAIKKGENSQF